MRYQLGVPGMVHGGLAGWDALTTAAMQQAAASATSSEVLQVNRARAAAAIDAGYDAMATYKAWQPAIFAASVTGVLVSGAALARRVKNPEAVALYGILGVISAVSAWFTRPDALRPAPQQAIPTDPNAPNGMAGAVGWLDQRVATNNAQRPGWEAATYTRLASDLGMGTLNPAVQTLLTQNSH